MEGPIAFTMVDTAAVTAHSDPRLTALRAPLGRTNVMSLHVLFAT
ncbi:MAG: hypothetical protein Q4A13_08050 [Fretibacterium sp.]|nr:hypothetical protein [Fretibacterium sp.]